MNESQQPAVHFDGCGHLHRPAVLEARLEMPLAHGFDGILVQAESQAPHDPRVVGEAVGSDHYLDHHGALQPRGTCFIAVLRPPLCATDGTDTSSLTRYASARSAGAGFAFACRMAAARASTSLAWSWRPLARRNSGENSLATRDLNFPLDWFKQMF